VLIEGTCFKFEEFQETSVEGARWALENISKNTEESSPFETESVKSSERNNASSHAEHKCAGR
jgi:hypothetical protein